jgi:hypothetical protein
LYALGLLVPGSLLLLGTAIWGAIRVRRGATAARFRPTRLGLAVLAVALVAAAYHRVCFDHWSGNQVLYSGYIQGDLYFHTHMAALLTEQGAPLVDYTGHPATPLSPPTHIGFSTLLAGVAGLGQIAVLQAPRVLIPLAYALIVLSGLGLVAQPGRSRRLVFVAAASGLLWGGLSIPIDIALGNIRGLWAPYCYSAVPFNQASGSLFHNGTQVYSVALTGVALLALRQWLASDSLRWLGLASGIAGATFLVKPSLTILTGPALLVLLLLRRARPRAWVTSVLTFASCSGAYLLPALYPDPAAEKFSWAVGLPNAPWGTIALRYGVLVGAACLFVGVRCRSLQRALRDRSVAQIEDLVAVAILGGVVFSLFFHEVGRQQYNEFWGLLAILALAAPLVTVCLLEGARRPAADSAVARRRFAAVLVGLHGLSGALCLVSYPLLDAQRVPVAEVAATEAFRAETAPGTRFLLDPSFPPALLPVLARPTFVASWGQIDSHRDTAKWKAIVLQRRDPRSMLAPRDAIIVGPRTEWMVSWLRLPEWQLRIAPPEQPWQLWTAPSSTVE